MDGHSHRPCLPVAAGDEFQCVCTARYVAVRQHWWSRRLTWKRILFSAPHREASPGRLGADGWRRELGRPG